MNCELCQTEMHPWRAGSEPGLSPEVLAHLSSCAVCASRYGRMVDVDERVRRTIRSVAAPTDLEGRIFRGLEHERRQKGEERSWWKLWLAVPLVACLMLAAGLVGRPYLAERQLQRDLSVLISQPPESQMVTTDRARILDWSAGELHGSSQLPPELGRVQFRGATSLEIAHRRAVLLKMKNEQRASLLVVEGALGRKKGFTFLSAAQGNASVWSDRDRTYVLLFRGDRQAMQTYMVKMGIVA